MKTPLPKHYTIAIEAAVAASEIIIPIYAGEFEAAYKDDGSPVTRADLASSAIITERLSSTGIPILGEETEHASYQERLAWDQNWCVDPLDGTKMFLQRNDEFSVNIAHIVNGKSIFGVIAAPVQREVLIGGMDIGVYLLDFDELHNPNRWKAITPSLDSNNPLVVACSRSFSDQQEALLRSHLPKDTTAVNILRKGSALKFFDLATGRADIYARFAPTMEWDIAAGHAILNALGGTIVSLSENTDLTYNKESLYNPHFIARTNALCL